MHGPTNQEEERIWDIRGPVDVMYMAKSSDTRDGLFAREADRRTD